MTELKTTTKPIKMLVVSDNEQIAGIIEAVVETLADRVDCRFVCSPGSPLEGRIMCGEAVKAIDIKQDYQQIIDGGYALVLSGHCKQIFPEALVKSVKCINIHPGFNPYNRGMFPHVFSLINGLPAGATLHEIDPEIDHGAIIDQEVVQPKASDTSASLYARIIEAEKRLLEKNLSRVVAGDYKTKEPEETGNMNTKKDFEALKEIDLDNVDTFGNHLNRLRALTHDDIRNAYFTDPETGRRVWVKIVLEED